MKKLIILLALCTTINAKALDDTRTTGTAEEQMDLITSTTCVEGTKLKLCQVDVLGTMSCFAIEKTWGMKHTGRFQIDCKVFKAAYEVMFLEDTVK